MDINLKCHRTLRARRCQVCVIWVQPYKAIEYLKYKKRYEAWYLNFDERSLKYRRFFMWQLFDTCEELRGYYARARKVSVHEDFKTSHSIASYVYGIGLTYL